MILSSHVSDEKFFFFLSLFGNSIPNLVRLSGPRCTTPNENASSEDIGGEINRNYQAASAAALRIRAHTASSIGTGKIVMTACAELDEITFAEEWRVGSTLTQDDAISYALMGLPS